MKIIFFVASCLLPLVFHKTKHHILWALLWGLCYVVGMISVGFMCPYLWHTLEGYKLFADPLARCFAILLVFAIITQSENFALRRRGKYFEKQQATENKS